MKLKVRQKSHINFRTYQDKTKYIKKGGDNMKTKNNDIDYIMNYVDNDYYHNVNTRLTQDDYYSLLSKYIMTELYSVDDNFTENDYEKQNDLINDFYTQYYRLILTNHLA